MPQNHPPNHERAGSLPMQMPACGAMSGTDLAQLVILAAIWGAGFIFMRLGAPEVGSLLSATLRITLAAIALLAFSHIKGIHMDWRRNLKPYALAGFFGAALPFFLFSYAAQYLPASFSALLNATGPLFGAFFSILWLAERLTVRKLAGLIMGVAGVWLLVGTSYVLQEKVTLLAIAACLAGPACFAISAIVVTRHAHHTTAHHGGRPGCHAAPPHVIDPLPMATGAMTAAALMLLPTLPFALPQTMPSTLALTWIAALAVFCSALAQVIFIPLVTKIGPTRAMSVSFLIPLFSLLWGVIFLQEAPDILSIAGGLVILAATGLILKA